jgi:vancomycin resistance protein VanJ
VEQTARRLARRPEDLAPGLILAALAILLALVMLLHSRIPNRIGNLGSLTETFLPWFGLMIPVLLILGLVRRSATALIAVVLPTIVWLNLFGGLLLSDKTGTGGDLTVATHNVNAENPDPSGTARDVAASGADVVALEELTASAVPTYEKALASTYKYHSVEGTVGLWSKYPMSGSRPSTSSWAGRARCAPPSPPPRGRSRSTSPTSPRCG